MNIINEFYCCHLLDKPNFAINEKFYKLLKKSFESMLEILRKINILKLEEINRSECLNIFVLILHFLSNFFDFESFTEDKKKEQLEYISFIDSKFIAMENLQKKKI
jgi:hypothetical protein